MSPLYNPDEQKPAGPPLDERELEMAARMFRSIGDLERLRVTSTGKLTVRERCGKHMANVAARAGEHRR